MAKLYFEVQADYDKVKKLREEIEKLKKTMQGFNSQTSAEKIKELEKELKSLRDAYDELTQKAAKSAVHIEKSGISLGKALAAVGGVAALKQLGSEIIRVRGEFQEMETAIETLVGKDMADKLLPQIKELAKVSPLTMTDIVGAEKMMLGFNIEADKTIGFLKALSDVSMGSSQKFNSLTLAFSQMSAAGKLMGQDLNQMINAGFNPLQQISQTTGKSIATLKEEMSKGAVSAEMVQQAFIDATSAGGKFYKMSENASKTINGQISMLEDAWDSALNEMGQKSEGIIMSGIQATTSLIQNYETVGKVLLTLVGTYGLYKAALIANIALEKVQAVQRLASIKGISTMSALTGVLTKKIGLLNAVMSVNPYVLLATAVTGVVAAMWAFHDSSTEAEKAQKRLAKRREEDAEAAEEHGRKIDSLIEKSRDLTLADLQRGESLADLRKEYPKIFEQYDIESIKLADILDLKRQIAEEDAKRAEDKEKKDLAKLNEQISALEFLSKRRNLNSQEKGNLTRLRADRDAILEEKGKGISEKFISSLKDVDINEFDKYVKVLEDKIRGKGEDGKIKMKLPIDVEGTLSEDALYNVSDIRGLINTIQTTKDKRIEAEKNKTTWQQDLKAAKDAWDIAKKELQAVKDNKESTSKDYENAVKKEKSAKSVYEKLGGKTDKQLKQEETAERKKLKLSDELLSIRRKNQQDEINLMKDGTEKKFAQINLDYQKEIDAINKQKEEWKKAQKGLLTEQQEAALKQQGLLAEKNRAKSIEDANKELLEKYQDYATQRVELEKKYNDDIHELQVARNKAEESGDKKTADKLTKSIAQAYSEKGKALLSFDFERFKESPEYVQAFEDLGNTSSETLQNLISELERYKNEAAKTFDAASVREYTDAIQQIYDALLARNPYEGLVNAQKDLAESNDELRVYAEILEKVKKGQNVLKTSSVNDETDKIEISYWNLTEATEAYIKAKDKHSKSESRFLKVLDTTKEEVDNLSNSIKGLGDSIGGSAGEIISLIGDVSLFVTSTIDGMAKVSATGANALSAVEKASVILGIISSAVQLLQKISNLLPDAHKQYQEYAAKVDEVNKLTDAVNSYKIAVLKAKQEEEGWFSENNLKNLKDYKEQQEAVYQSYIDKMTEAQAVYQNKSGGGWLTDTFNGIMAFGSVLSPFEWWRDIWGYGGYDEGTTAAVNNLRIETRKASKGFLGSGIGGKSQKTEDLRTWAKKNLGEDLFDKDGWINVELANEILENYGNKLQGQTQETLEALIEMKEQYDEYIKQLRDYVSSLYEPLVDNFVDSLWDWFDEGKSALDSFKDYASETFRDIVSDMMKTIILEQVVGSFGDDIGDLYEEYSKGLVTEEQLMANVSERVDGLMSDYEDNIPMLQAMMSQLDSTLQEAGINLASSSAYSQEASSKGFEGMSQDTGDELNGRFAALQISGEETKNQVTLLNITANEIKAIQMGVRDIASGIQDQLASSYLELVAINENTGVSAKYLKDIKADISEVKENTKRL